jgi:hypothetical protein
MDRSGVLRGVTNALLKTNQPALFLGDIVHIEAKFVKEHRKWEKGSMPDFQQLVASGPAALLPSSDSDLFLSEVVALGFGTTLGTGHHTCLKCRLAVLVLHLAVTHAMNHKHLPKKLIAPKMKANDITVESLEEQIHEEKIFRQWAVTFDGIIRTDEDNDINDIMTLKDITIDCAVIGLAKYRLKYDTSAINAKHTVRGPDNGTSAITWHRQILHQVLTTLNTCPCRIASDL